MLDVLKARVENHARAAANLEHSLRAKVSDAFDRLVQPLAHRRGGDRFARVAAEPARCVEARWSFVGTGALCVGGIPAALPISSFASRCVSCVGCATCGQNVANELRLTGTVLHGNDGLLDRWVPLQEGFDFPELDPVAVDLDLLVESTEVLQRAVIGIASQVTGPVNAVVGLERVHDESFGS